MPADLPAVPRRRLAKPFSAIRAGLSSCDGSTAAEFALVVPMLLALFFGVIDFGRAIWVRNSLQSAVEAAARCYALNRPACDTTAEVRTYAAGAAVGVQIPSSAFTPSTVACGKKVTASYAFTSIVPLIPLDMTIQASACRPTV